MIGDPEVPIRNSSLSRGSTGSDLAISPCSFGNTTLRRQQSELGRLNLESFKSSWGTKTLSPGGGGQPGPIRGTSNQGFGGGNGRLTSPWGTVQQVENENNKYHTPRDGTTFRTSTNLSDICKLWMLCVCLFFKSGLFCKYTLLVIRTWSVLILW